MATELEVKFAVPTLEGLRGNLRGLGASLKVEATLERNWVLDDSCGNLRKKGCLLRLRQWGERHCLTFKGPARFAGGLKVREELEVGVEGSTILDIFKTLGFSPVFYYEKQRETWEQGAAEVALDHTPMGDFVEIEGEEQEVRRVVSALGLRLDEALQGTYAELWQRYRESHPHLPPHMVFP